MTICFYLLIFRSMFMTCACKNVYQTKLYSYLKKKTSEKIYQWKVVKNPITHWSYKNLSHWLTLIFYNNDDSTKRAQFIVILITFMYLLVIFLPHYIYMHISTQKKFGAWYKTASLMTNLFPHLNSRFHLFTSVPAIQTH